jgi:hypothetical protein
LDAHDEAYKKASDNSDYPTQDEQARCNVARSIAHFFTLSPSSTSRRMASGHTAGAMAQQMIAQNDH